MNLELLNPFAQDFPENFESSIDANAGCSRFNPRGLFAGHFLAVGRLDGVVTVLDFETKGIVRWLEGHVKAVTTICWSQNSRYLLTASKDWNVIIWDLSSSAASTVEGERRHTVRFDAPVTSAHLHPRHSRMLVVTLASQVQPVFVDLRNTNGGRWDLETTIVEEEEEEEDEDASRKLKEVATVARFNPRGDLIYVGTSKGNVHVWDVQTKEFLHTENLSNSAVKHMEFDVKGSALVTNCNDRCIRVIQLLNEEPQSDSEVEEDDDENASSNGSSGKLAQPRTPRPPALPRPSGVPYFEVQHRFQDLVERTPWNGCGFSRDGEYILGGAGHKSSHNIYVWDRASGGLMKILEGPKDPLEDLDWHPIRPLIASVSSLGLIHIWTTGITENWSAYAPGFEELDENVEYQEKEDEFDIEDESVIKQREEEDQNRPVDIMTIAPFTHNATLFPILTDSHASYENFLRSTTDDEEEGDDTDEAFYPPPQLEEYYDPEEVVVAVGAASANVLSNGSGGDVKIEVASREDAMEDEQIAKTAATTLKKVKKRPRR